MILEVISNMQFITVCSCCCSEESRFERIFIGSRSNWGKKV